MPFKDILVHLDAAGACRRRLDYAVRLASRDEAHLTGLYTVDFVPMLAELVRGQPGRIEQFETYNKLRAAELDLASQVESEFREALRRTGVEGEWRLVEGPHAQTAALHSRYVDLAIVGQIDPDRPPVPTVEHIPEKILLTSGRPILVFPRAGGFETIGQHALVAWTATAEAARALADALPLLERAEKATVLTVNPARIADAETGIPGADIAIHLARHGIKAEAMVTVADEITVGNMLLNTVADRGVDLLVMGGYGHPASREMMFGGVTRQILQQTTVPVLLAH